MPFLFILYFDVVIILPMPPRGPISMEIKYCIVFYDLMLKMTHLGNQKLWCWNRYLAIEIIPVKCLVEIHLSLK